MRKNAIMSVVAASFLISPVAVFAQSTDTPAPTEEPAPAPTEEPAPAPAPQPTEEPAPAPGPQA